MSIFFFDFLLYSGVRQPFRVHHFFLYLKAIGIGLLAGSIVTGYRFILVYMTAGRWILSDAARKNPILYFPVFTALIASALLVGFIVYKYPMLKGSGIPQIKGGLRGFFKLSWFPELPLKFFGGLLTLGCGLSLGREGPSIQLGGLTACAVNKKFAKSGKEEDYLLTAGAAAGLTAAFNAPLSGVLFTFEELRNRLTHTGLVTAILSCISAGIISEALMGQLRVFSFTFPHMIPVKDYFLLIPLGIACGIFAVIFNRSLFLSQDLHSFIKKPLLRPSPAFLVTGILFVFFPLFLGSGHDLLQEIKAETFSIPVLLILILTKLLFTSLCYGSGSPGGIFLPLLMLGAIIGKSYELLLVDFFGYPHIYGSFFIALGMTAFFSGVTKAPITGCVLIMEMTASLNHLIPLIIVALTSYAVATYLGGTPVYDELLERMLSERKKNGIYPGREVG